MTKPSLRNRRVKRKLHKTPGGKTTELNERRRGKVAYCKLCSKKLQGIRPEGGKRKTSRLFSGELCASCAKKVVEYGTRVNSKLMKANEVPLKYANYIKKIVK